MNYKEYKAKCAAISAQLKELTATIEKINKIMGENENDKQIGRTANN